MVSGCEPGTRDAAAPSSASEYCVQHHTQIAVSRGHLRNCFFQRQTPGEAAWSTCMKAAYCHALVYISGLRSPPPASFSSLTFTKRAADRTPSPYHKRTGPLWPHFLNPKRRTALLASLIPCDCPVIPSPLLPPFSNKETPSTSLLHLFDLLYLALPDDDIRHDVRHKGL
jgi:hypothetical protein